MFFGKMPEPDNLTEDEIKDELADYCTGVGAFDKLLEEVVRSSNPRVQRQLDRIPNKTFQELLNKSFVTAQVRAQMTGHFGSILLDMTNGLTNEQRQDIKQRLMPQIEELQNDANQTHSKLIIMESERRLARIAILLAILSIFISLFVYLDSNRSEKKWQQLEINRLEKIESAIHSLKHP